MVSHPETGSDSPIGSDRDRGHDNEHNNKLSQNEAIHIKDHGIEKRKDAMQALN